jgi:fructose-1,6-bisphosphatase
LRGLHEEFERDVRILKSEYDQEKADIARTHDSETQELREMIETIEEEEKAKLKAINEAFLAEKEQTRNKNVEEQETMKMDLIKKIDALDNAFEVSFQQYMSETEPKTGEYAKLLDSND